MRNFAFDNDSADTSAANIAGIRPNLEQPVESLRLDEPLDEPAREALRDDALSAFHRGNDDGDSDNNAAKIAGAVLVGLLLVGGSIYAYESTVTNHAPQTVAMLPPAPQHNATAEQTVTPPVTTPDIGNAPSASSTAPAVPAAKPVRNSVPSRQAAATPEPAAVAAPAATPAPAQQDAAINQPMTLTPETAPAPQQSAMQQPITAPNVSGPTAQPTPEVANNNASSGVILPDNQPTAPADTAAPAAPSDTTSPATPAAPLPAPAQ